MAQGSWGTRLTGSGGSLSTRLTEHKAHWAQGSRGKRLTEHKALRAQGFWGTTLAEHKAHWTQGSRSTRLTGHKALGAQGSLGKGLIWHNTHWVRGLSGHKAHWAQHSLGTRLTEHNTHWVRGLPGWPHRSPPLCSFSSAAGLGSSFGRTWVARACARRAASQGKSGRVSKGRHQPPIVLLCRLHGV